MNTNHDLADMRESYQQYALDEHTAGSDPIALFAQWFDAVRAAGQVEPNAMSLATVNSAGQPSARMVLLKSFSEDGFTFFTHSTSRKGQEIAHNDHVALVFWWSSLERQVRIEGRAQLLPIAAADAYFARRPRASQLGALASAQSEVINSRTELEAQLQQLAITYQDSPVPRPTHWRGYNVKPTSIEFWQGRDSRLHDRLLYQLCDKHSLWQRERLAP